MSETPTMETENERPVYFWSQKEKPYGIFSQWYASPFGVDDIKYHTAEMWMMVQKAKLFGDEEIVNKMMNTTSPREHKDLGRKAKGFDWDMWEEHKCRIVEEGNYHKFTKGKDAVAMRKVLLGTGEREIVEASPQDPIWGIGFAAAIADENRAYWGENLLGKALMGTRDRLRREGYS